MAQKAVRCPKCDTTMERGFVCQSWTIRPLQVSTWVKGRPETPAVFGTKTQGRKPLVVVTWRCAECGRLESYAS